MKFKIFWLYLSCSFVAMSIALKDVPVEILCQITDNDLIINDLLSLRCTCKYMNRLNKAVLIPQHLKHQKISLDLTRKRDRKKLKFLNTIIRKPWLRIVLSSRSGYLDNLTRKSPNVAKNITELKMKSISELCYNFSFLVRLKNLQHLDMSNAELRWISLKNLAEIVTHHHFTNLVSLRLGRKFLINEEQLKNINWPMLEILDLGIHYWYPKSDNTNLSFLAQLKLPKLRELGLRGNIIGLGHLKYLKNFLQLEILDLSSTGLRKEISNLLDLSLNNLKKLYLNKNQLGLLEIKVLTQKKWPKLLLLSLSFNAISGEALNHINSTNFPMLLSLYLDNNHLQQEELEINPLDLPNLTLLSLNDNKIGPDGIKKLYLLANIEYLSLNNNHIGSKGLRYLIASPLIKIKMLDLAGNKISDQHMPKFFKKFPSVCSLDLSENRLSKLKFISNKQLTNLRCLNMSSNSINHELLSNICIICTNIEILNISDCNIDNEKLELLTKLKSLQILYIKNNIIKNEKILKKFTHLKKLEDY